MYDFHQKPEKTAILILNFFFKMTVPKICIGTNLLFTSNALLTGQVQKYDFKSKLN